MLYIKVFHESQNLLIFHFCILPECIHTFQGFEVSGQIPYDVTIDSLDKLLSNISLLIPEQ